MKVTILWEDQRGGLVKSFGPHELLVASVADELAARLADVRAQVDSVPKKGNGNVIRALQDELGRLEKLGPVCAVLDLDRVVRLWPADQRPFRCFGGIRTAINLLAPGSYEIALLDQNVETLVDACCDATGTPRPPAKLSPMGRDRVLMRGAADAAVAAKVRASMPSFDRLVRWVARQVRSAST